LVSSVLVFPSNMPQAQVFSRVAKSLGLLVVEATSEHVSQDLKEQGVVSLPYVTEENFDDEFSNLVGRFQIELVYAPHLGVWRKLIKLSANSDLCFKVCNGSPHQEDLRPYGFAYEWADSCLANVNICERSSEPLSISRYAGLYQGYSSIPGQSDDLKIWLLTQIFRCARQGDVVEIGSAYGRSAFALAWLSSFHSIGPVICVDPWNVISSESQGKQATLIDQMVLDFNFQKIFEAFIASVSGFKNVNYIKKPSGEAVIEYRAAGDSGYVISKELGATKITGSISILHIDGNHKYEEVRRDLEGWLPFVKPGGWILFDDYVWAFGDGPKRVGDEFIASQKATASFVVGDTLCVRV